MKETNAALRRGGLALRLVTMYDKCAMGGKGIKISPSILSADFACLGEEVAQAEAAGADSIHIDVMDGAFVPVISIGLPVVRALRRVTSLPLEAHLMIARPEKFIAAFAEAGADGITLHQESSLHLHRMVQEIKECGRKAGVALNPATPLSTLEEILPYLDTALIMTVNPGFAGQEFIPGQLSKIERLSRLITERGYSCELAVDGGINLHTASQVAQAGAEVLVAASAIFGHPQGIRAGLAALRESALTGLKRRSEGGPS